MIAPSEILLINQILGLKLHNPHSGVDVECDDVLQYMEETDAIGADKCIEGFKIWLND